MNIKKIKRFCNLLSIFSLVMLIIELIPNTNPIFTTFFWISMFAQLLLRSALFLKQNDKNLISVIPYFQKYTFREFIYWPSLLSTKLKKTGFLSKKSR